MRFDKMTFEDLRFVEENSLYADDDKEHPEHIDYDVALRQDDKVLAVGGFRVLNSNTAWAWVQLSKYVMENYLVITYRVIKEWQKKWCKDNGIRRLQASVRCGFESGKRLAEHLGFEKEFKMRDFFGKDKDGWMYVKLIGEDN